MPFILLLFAAVFIVCGYQGTLGQLGSLLKQDFTGKNNFGTWLFAFFIIGALGYLPGFKKLSDAFLLLVIIVIILVNDRNGTGFFQGITAAENGGASATQQNVTPTSLTSGGIFGTPNGSNNLTIASV